MSERTETVADAVAHVLVDLLAHNAHQLVGPVSHTTAQVERIQSALAEEQRRAKARAEAEWAVGVRDCVDLLRRTGDHHAADILARNLLEDPDPRGGKGETHT